MVFDIDRVLVDKDTGELIGYILQNYDKPLYKCAVTEDKLKVLDPSLYDMRNKMDVVTQPVIMYKDNYAIITGDTLFLKAYEHIPLERLETGEFIVKGYVIAEHNFCPLDNKDAIRRCIKGYE